jgi:hypothetical protein
LRNFYIRKVDEKYVLNWLVVQIFQNTFTFKLWYIMIIIWKVETISIHIRFLSTWKYNNFNQCLIFMYLWFYFTELWHIIFITCISKNVIIQYYAMKSKNFLVLIIDVNNIHEFNIFKYVLCIFSKKIASVSN